MRLRVHPDGGFWPTPEQELLLRAALLQGETALAAWKRWSERGSSGRLDEGSKRLLPLVYRNLTRQGVTMADVAALKSEHRRTWFRNQVLLKATQSALRALDQAGIPTILLKGLSLCMRSYRDMGARPMADADVLVPRACGRAALEALTDAGWVAERRIDQVRLDYHHGISLVGDGGCALDLHWLAFGPQFQYETEDDLWERRSALDLDGVPTATLCSADELLHLVVHGMRWDVPPPLRWVADAAVLIGVRNDEEPVDWQLLVRGATQRELVLPVREGLTFLRNRLGAPVPARALESLGGAPIRRRKRLEYWLDQQPCPNLFVYPFHYLRVCKASGESPGPRGLARYVHYMMELGEAREVLPQLLHRLRRWPNA